MLEHSAGLVDFTQTIELEIDGEWYSWPTRGVAGYQMADISPFTSRTSTGQVKLSDLVGIAVLEQSGWVTGHGQPEFIETARYWYGQNIWTPDGKQGLSLGPYYQSSVDNHTATAATASNHSFKYARVIPIKKPWYGRATASNNTKEYFIVSNTRSIYIGESKEETSVASVDVTGTLLSTPVNIPYPNDDFEDPGAGTPNWFEDTVDPHISGSKSIVSSGGSNWLQLDVSESSPGTALLGEKYVVASEYIPVPSDAQIQYSVTLDTNLVSGYGDWAYKVEVYPVIYDVIGGSYRRGAAFSETIPFVSNGPLTHTTAAFTPQIDPITTSSGSTKDPSIVVFLEIRLIVEVAQSTPAATQIQYNSVKLNVDGTEHVFVYDLYYNGLALLAATNVGILYCTNLEEVIDSSIAATWKRVNEFAVVPARKFATFDGLFWYAEADTAILHYGSSPYGDDLEARTTDNTHPAYWFSKDGSTGLGDAGAIIVGDPTDRIVNLFEYNNKLWVFKEKSIYYIYNNSGVYVPVRFSEHDYHPENFATIAYYDGALVYWMNGRVYRFLESSIVDITPPVTYEYGLLTGVANYPVKGFVAVGPYLFAFDQQRKYIVYDGAGWHSCINPVSVNQAMDYDASSWTGAFVGGNLLVFGTDGARSTLLSVGVNENGVSHAYKNINPQPIRSDGYAVTSWVDGGLPNVDKHFHSLIVEAAFEDENSWVDVEFVVDDGEGNYRTYGPKRIHAPKFNLHPTIFDTPVAGKRLYKIELPNDFVGKRIQMRFTLSEGGGYFNPYNAPHVWRWLLNYVPRPWTIYGYAPSILITHTTKTRNNLTKQWTPREQIDLLLSARDSRAPIRMRDPITNTIREVYVSAVKIQPLVRRTKGNVQDETFLAEISLVEFKI